MNFRPSSNITQEGDLVQLVGLSHKNFLVRLKSGIIFQSHRGVIPHDALIGIEWGTLVSSHQGNPFYVLQPSFADLLIETPRSTQILYPKDIGFILLNLGVGPNSRIVEAGSGSGALTCAFANAIGETGSIVSYEIKADIQNRARKNLDRLGLLDRVELKLRDIAEGFDETNADILFLDVSDPHNYLAQVRSALKPGGSFGCILPTANQVSMLITELRRMDFIYIEVCEILLRYYKTEPTRFRPVDRMIAHTGFLIFARPIIKPPAKPEALDLLVDEVEQPDVEQGSSDDPSGYFDTELLAEPDEQSLPGDPQ